ncbi:MAG: BamA/TamA family outer membrane protein, partial [Bacteroidia bacterium]|nr:BamA/TamA family outer membrane protein [Bacteroidia bacterium]
YGIGYASEKLDYRFNPRKGYSIELTGSVGKKKINKNTKVNEELYDSLDLSSTQYKVELTFDYYVPLGKLHVLDFGVIAALLEAEDIFDNELYRFGGLKTLRGFDEEILRASKFTIWKIEYRYLLEQNSFLFLFVNGAFYKSESRNLQVEDDPIGFGAGINFETKLGIFSFNYALGKEFNNPFIFRTAKLHFGIVNYF